MQLALQVDEGDGNVPVPVTVLNVGAAQPQLVLLVDAAAPQTLQSPTQLPGQLQLAADVPSASTQTPPPPVQRVVAKSAYAQVSSWQRAPV